MVSTYMARLARILGGSRFKDLAFERRVDTWKDPMELLHFGHVRATKNIPMGPAYVNRRQGSRLRGSTVRRVPDMSRDKMINPYMIPTTEVRVGPKGQPFMADAVYKMHRSDTEFLERHLSSQAWNKVFNNPSPKPRSRYIESTDNIPQKKSFRAMPKPKTLARGYTAKPPSRAPPHRVKGYSGKGARKVDKAHFPSEADLDRKLAGRGRRYN